MEKYQVIGVVSRGKSKITTTIDKTFDEAAEAKRYFDMVRENYDHGYLYLYKIIKETLDYVTL